MHARKSYGCCLEKTKCQRNERVHKTLSLEEKLTILDELSSKTHRQLAEIRHLYIANTHYNDIHFYYNDIHYFTGFHTGFLAWGGGNLLVHQ